MEYLLKKDEADKGVLCEKVTIDGFDYYVSDIKPKDKEWFIFFGDKQTSFHQFHSNNGYGVKTYTDFNKKDGSSLIVSHSKCSFKIIATTNPYIDIPKVVDEVEVLAEKSSEIQEATYTSQHKITYKHGFIDGYNKAQSTHPYSEEDMLDLIQSLKDYTAESHNILGHDDREPIEFLNIFKSSRPKVIYYDQNS